MSNVRPVPDAEARERIARELDRNLLVEAGAGSGKTEALARRMAAGIAQGVYTLEQMAAVTFTRKAAAELRGRFQLALERALSQSDASGSRDRLHHALSNLERFFAGTIHSFCARLLRERPVEAGVSPGFTELDEVEEALLMQQSWRDYRAQARGRGDADVMALLEANITAKKLDKAFETICLYEDVRFPPGDAPIPDAGAAWKSLDTFWTTLQGLLPDPIPSDTTCATQKRAAKFDRQWRAYRRGEREARLLADCLETWQSKPSVVQMRWEPKSRSKIAEKLHAEFREKTVFPYLAAWRQYLYKHCVTLLVRARDAARDERRRRNALSFSDLLILTADVLRTNGDVRRALQEKYRWLFVDEFQDTDPVQAEIMFLLAADERDDRLPLFAGAGDADWRTVPLRPGALFVVGDPKQSIYRFRRADIDIYNEVRERLRGADGRGVVQLTTNFRSVPGLCSWANDVFKARFPATPTTHAPMFAPLDHHREPDGRGPDIAVIDLPGTIDARGVAAHEASRIARYIRAEVDAGRRQFGDFLILTRRKKGLRPCAAALEALQIPLEVNGAGAFGESQEVRTIALLLSALADAQDAVTLVGVLRGPLFGLSDQDLFAFRQAGGYFNLFSEIATNDASAARVADALATLRRWSAWTRMLPAGAALERILDDSGYLALAATSQGGVEAGDLLHAVDRVRAVVEDGFTLAEAAAALASWSGLDEDNRMEEPAEVDSLPLEPGRRDVVRLMNLHKAKGLEAKVVFLADPLGGFEPRVDVRIVRQRDGAVGYLQIEEEFKSGGRRVIAEPQDWERHEAEEKAYLQAEGDRLLYVAATRARDLLVIGRYGRPGGRTPAWNGLTAKMRGAPEIVIPAAAAPTVAAPLDLSAAAAAAAMAASMAAHTRARRASWDTTSVTAEAKRLPTVEVEATTAPDVPDPTRSIVPATASHRADAGLGWGTLIHGLLEHAMRHATATRADLRRLAMWLTVDEPQLRRVIDQALDTVETVARADFWREARAASERHEEVPFAVRHTRGSVPTIVTGAIDLVHRTTEGWRVLDYKTDVDLGDPETQRRYARQVEDYAAAWARVSAAPVSTTVVQARRTG